MRTMKTAIVALFLLAVGCGGAPISPQEMCDPGQCSIFCDNPKVPTYCVDPPAPCDAQLYCGKQ